MEPRYDPVVVLLETPFRRWKEEDKRQLLKDGRPTPNLSIQSKKEEGPSQHCRSFQPSWYVLFSWLCGSSYLQRMFCWPCLIVGIKKGVWNETGYGGLTTIRRACNTHEGSLDHLKNTLKFNELVKSGNPIADALKENSRLYIVEFNKKVTMNRRLMQLPIKAVLFLSKQEIPFGFGDHDKRGNSSNRGNFNELLNVLISEAAVDIQQHYLNIKTIFEDQSETIQNELIDSVYFHVHEFIKNEISGSSFFSVQVDDATDISPESQCSIILRYVSPNGLVVERFLGFFDSTSRTAEDLFQLLETVLGSLEYRAKLIAQCYDGSSVTRGYLTYLQAKIKCQAPQALFVHCCGHRLDLVLKQSVNDISECRIFFANLSSMTSFFHQSAKGVYLLNSIIDRKIPIGTDDTNSKMGNSNIKMLRVVTDEWKGLKEVFEKILSDPNAEESWIRRANGFLNCLNDFGFSLLSLIFDFIFQQTDALYDILLNKYLDMNYCLRQVNVTRNILIQNRNEDTFKRLFETVNSRTEIVFKTQDGFRTQEEVFEKFKVLYFEILDTIIMEFDVRFKDNECLYFFCLADSSNFDYFSRYAPEKALESLKNSYPSVVTDFHRLKNELKLFYSDLSYRNCSVQEMIKKMHENGTKDVFEEVYKLLSLILTIPATNITAERSVSCLERIKNNIRNSMPEERSTALSTLSIERGIIDDLAKTTPFYDDILDRFASLQEWEIDLTFKK